MIYRRASEDAATVVITKTVATRTVRLSRALEACARATESIYVAGPGWRGVLATFAVECAGKLMAGEMHAYARRVQEAERPGENTMSTLMRLFKFTAVLALLILPVVALAQAVAPASMPADLPLDQAFSQLGPIIASLKGAGALGIAIAVTQILLLVARTPLANFAGKWKLVIIAGLATVTTYLGLVSAGAPWLAALLMGPVMAAVQVFAHQIYVNFKPDTQPPA